MVVGILLAGGSGLRMGANVPKQFLEIKGKPVVQYPLEIMEKHPMIDAIEIVCVDRFIDEAWRIVKEAGISKVKWITAAARPINYSVLLTEKTFCESECLFFLTNAHNIIILN